jgi:hypothetical protein
LAQSVDIAMGMITIQCPRTGKQVATGVEIDKARYDRMRETRFTMTCWLCGQEHEWSKRWATFVENFGGEDDGSLHGSSDARVAEQHTRSSNRSKTGIGVGVGAFRKTRH